jgi:diacylglycerol kinase (ATP)
MTESCLFQWPALAAIDRLRDNRKAAMERLVKAFFNSVRAFSVLFRSEKAFQQELALLVVALPVGWFLSSSWSGYALLIGAVLMLIMVEVLNTGIEAACDAISREFHIDIQLAKDCGSLAVLISVILVAGVWGIALAERVSGAPV